MAWFSTIEQPLIRDLSIGALQLFAGDLRLDEARQASFRSLRDCFTRELKPGARPIDPRPGILVSPCDGIVGAFGRIRDATLVQAKGFAYTLEDLLGDEALALRYRDGTYVTLRLTASMYHHFHAPQECEVRGIRHIPGDVWNVNPATLGRVPRVFCRNERVVIDTRLAASRESVTLVAVGAVLVASVCLTFLDHPLDSTYAGTRRIACRVRLRKGDAMGYFRHGSTIIVLGTRGIRPVAQLSDGRRIQMGEPLLEPC